mgnify:CR=1 FL=1
MRRSNRPLVLRFSAVLGLVVACFALVACSRSPENAAADEKVLCDPLTGDAYFVRPGVGDTSFVRRHPVMAGLCKKA